MAFALYDAGGQLEDAVQCDRGRAAEDKGQVGTKEARIKKLAVALDGSGGSSMVETIGEQEKSSMVDALDESWLFVHTFTVLRGCVTKLSRFGL